MSTLLWTVVLLAVLKTSQSQSQSQFIECEGLVNVQDFHDYAKNNVEPKAMRYYDGVGLLGKTYQDNIDAFSRLRIRPRYMRDVSNRNLETTILGHKVKFPIGISPHAAQAGAHPDGEIGTAKAARDSGIVMILSSYSTISLENVAAAVPNGLRWFQVYIYSNRNLTRDLVQRAEKADYKALVLNIDSPVESIRYFWDRDAFTVPSGYSYANFEVYVNDLHSRTSVEEDRVHDITATWQDLAWLTSITNLPVVVKGVLTAEDARLAVQYGAAAILVSNHGGRQLDGVPATIEALPEIVEAVGNEVEVYIDGGFRTGGDAFKALSLGARAVFYGRPNVWGLSYKGAKGSKCVMDIFKRELDRTMALAGYKNAVDISMRSVVKEEYYRQPLPYRLE